ncbi:hypothetical protein H6F95_19705 [Cyanobacteria bacterium FACHB-471]|nr:hypothetical protein [Cyanobacteria bacterium FACHB-471]
MVNNAFRRMPVSNVSIQNTVASDVASNTVVLSQIAAVQLAQPAPASVVSETQVAQIDRSILADAVVARQPEAIASIGSSLYMRPEQIRWINPDLGRAIADIRTPTEGTPRNQITVPLSLTADVSDETVFESPTNSAQKYYLPRYRIAERNRQVQMVLTQTQTGWNLAVYLEKFPAPSLQIAARDYQELAHELSVVLQHRLTPGDANGGQKELAFSAPVLDSGMVRVDLQITTSTELGLLFQVLTLPEYGAVLTVRRAVKVGIPVYVNNSTGTVPNNSAANTGASFTIPMPQLRVVRIENYEAGGQPWTRYCLSVDNYAAFPADLFAASPDLPPCGLNRNASRTWVNIHAEGGATLYGFCALGSPSNLKDLWFARPRGQQPPASVYITLVDRRNNITYASNSVNPTAIAPAPPDTPPAGEALFREVTRVLESGVEPRPFVFPQAIYPYIYQGITGSPNQTFTLQRWTVPWDGTPQSYYQDPVRREIVYFLPDCFKLMRQPKSPYHPMMSMRFAAVNDDPATLRATFDYWAFPHVERARLLAAAPILREKFRISGQLEFQPLLVEKPRLFLKLPKANATPQLQEFTHVSVELRSGFSDSLSLSFEEAQALYEAMFSHTTQIFEGFVQVDIQGHAPERINFIPKVDDLVGEVFDYTKIVDSANKTVAFTLRNSIESPLRIESLSCVFQEGYSQVEGVMSGFSRALPVELKPGETISFTVTPQNPGADINLSNVLFNLNGVKVIPDRDALFNVILRPDCPSTFKKKLTVDVRRVVFGDRITDISLVFKRGSTLKLSYDDFAPGVDKLTATTTLLSPIKSLFLKEEDLGTYEFQRIVLLKDGRKIQDPPDYWQTENENPFSLTNSDLPTLPAEVR